MKRLLLLLAISSAAAASQNSGWNPVNESESNLQLAAESAEVSLALEGRAEPVRATLRLEWLDEKDAVLGSARTRILIPSQGARARLTLPFGWSRIPEERRSDILWHRLRYRLTTSGTSAEGIFSVSELDSNLFRIQISQPRIWPDQETVKVIARAVHPLTEKPLANVALKAQLRGKNAAPIDWGTSVTDESGFTAFDVPTPLPADHLHIHVEGNASGFVQQAQLEVEMESAAGILISTDRKLYQPGQTLRSRAILFNARGRALAGAPVRIRVLDGRSRPHYQTEVQSTRFGIVVADWTIPDNAALGSYRVEVSAPDNPEISPSSEILEISRYELPVFSVRVRPDRPYYLDGDSPTVEVEAIYTHGSPLGGGAVAVSREETRCWTGRGTETYKAERVQSKLNRAGRTELKLGTPPPCYASYLATVTDPISRRSESHRFTLTYARQPIKIRTVRDDNLSTRLPRTFYIETEYADGRPAECEVEIHLAGDGENPASQRLLTTVRTNRDGLAEVADFLLPSTEKEKVRLLFVAKDPTGRRGGYISQGEKIHSPGVRIRSDKSLYRYGEPIQVHLKSTEQSELVHVVITSDFSLVDWFPVRLQKGAAELVIPFRETFRGLIGVRVERPDVSLAERDSSPESAFDSVSVYYPSGSLSVQLEPAESTYRPGSQATVHVRATKGGGEPAEAAIGLAAIDQASDQRARERSDSRHRRRAHSEPEEWHPEDSDSNSAEDQLRAAAIFSRHYSRYSVYFPYMLFRDKVSYLYSPVIKTRLEQYRRAWNLCQQAGNCPTDEKEFQSFLTRHGFSAGGISDPWGNSFRPIFTKLRVQAQLDFLSAGPDKKFGTPDDVKIPFDVWRPYDTVVGEIRAALNQTSFPRSKAEFEAILNRAGINPSRMLDFWGNPYAVDFTDQELTLVDPGARDKRVLPDSKASAESISRTYKVPAILLISSGPDNKHGTKDDFPVTAFVAAHEAELSPGEIRAGKPRRLGNRAGMQGRVMDAHGAAVTGAEIAVTSLAGRLVAKGASDKTGNFYFLNLPPGVYTLTVSSPGFQRFVARSVRLTAGAISYLDLTLRVATMYEQIMVEAEPAQLQTAMSMAAIVSPLYARKAPAPPPPPPQAAPGVRIRQHFPETLLWAPLLETGPDGRVEVSFPMADSITTWKLSAIGSTVDGLVARASDSLRSFQPFFVEHDPPPVLTAGDEITLPVVVRNYLEQPQQVSLAMGQEPWFRMEDPSERTLNVPAQSAAVESFRFTAHSPIESGRQEITARGQNESDAIRKTIRVVPDGRMVTEVRNLLFETEAAAKLTVPAEALPGSAKATLRLYPSLIEHIIDSPDAMLQRPYGCGEQTISSTFPNLLLLAWADAGGRLDERLRQRAQVHLQRGYERLLGYRSASGGFEYFSGRGPDAALTAYALDFLRAARAHIAVDSAVVDLAASWLRQQLPKAVGRSRAFLLRSLAEHYAGNKVAPDAIEEALQQEDADSDPYVLAQRLIHAVAMKRPNAAEPALERLLSTAIKDGDSIHWGEASHFTPFFSWGRAGTIETTATVLRALLTARQTGLGAPATDGIIRSGLLYLLEAKDESGLWYSTQTSMRVLDVLLQAARSDRDVAEVAVTANGNPIRIEGRTVDLSDFANKGSGDLSFRKRPGGLAMAQVISTYYVPWELSPPSGNTLQLTVAYSTTTPGVGESVTCKATATRLTGGSYGMMIAEVGLPPGADVDRSSLEAAKDYAGGMQRYEVLPDRVIAYLWPRSDTPARFEFTFRPRFPMQAKTPASRLYDYYNPSAQTLLPPTRFMVSPAPDLPATGVLENR